MLVKRDIGIETGEMFYFKGCECKYMRLEMYFIISDALKQSNSPQNAVIQIT